MLLEEPIIKELQGITVACDDPYKTQCPQKARWVGVTDCCGAVYIVCDEDKQQMQSLLQDLPGSARHRACFKHIDYLEWSPISGCGHEN